MCSMLLLLVVVLFGVVEPHGRLILPAARNCMWRFGFPNPINYDDAGLYCGGFQRQWKKNKGIIGNFIEKMHLRTVFDTVYTLHRTLKFVDTCNCGCWKG